MKRFYYVICVTLVIGALFWRHNRYAQKVCLEAELSGVVASDYLGTSATSVGRISSSSEALRTSTKESSKAVETESFLNKKMNSNKMRAENAIDASGRVTGAELSGHHRRQREGLSRHAVRRRGTTSWPFRRVTHRFPVGSRRPHLQDQACPGSRHTSP